METQASPSTKRRRWAGFTLLYNLLTVNWFGTVHKLVDRASFCCNYFGNFIAGALRIYWSMNFWV
jgi:hypothetical protein